MSHLSVRGGDGRFELTLGDDQTMPLRDRPDIHERKHRFGLEQFHPKSSVTYSTC